MDEVKYKLNTGNSVLIVNAVEKLITIIKTNYKPAEKTKFVLENEELKFLREICSSADTVVSLTACQGLLALVECSLLEIATTMSTVIALLPTARNYSGIVSTMAGLLILDLKSRPVPGQPYKCQFSMKSPQHPFITVLEKNAEATKDVLSQMHALCSHPDYIVQSNSVELLRPVFRWLVCVSDRVEGQQAFRLLLSLSDSEYNTSQLTLECICWQQTTNPKRIDSTLSIYSAVIEAAIYQKNVELITGLAPSVAALSNVLVRHGRDPRACYNLLNQCFSLDEPELRLVAGLTIVLLADNLSISCALHLHELFNLCQNIISKYEVPSIAESIFLSQSLQWLHLPSCLTEKALKIASKLLDSIQNPLPKENKLNMINLQRNKLFQTLIHTDKKIGENFKILRTMERCYGKPAELKSWLDSFKSLENVLKFNLVGLFSGLLFENYNFDQNYDIVKLKCLDYLLEMVDFRKELAVNLLPVLIYKVANDSSPKVKLECLKAVPVMAKSKENVPSILQYLKKLDSDRGPPTSLLISLHCSLTEQQARCFPQLQQVMTATTVKHADTKWETEVARAWATARVCEFRPTSGVELVSVISSILNRCTDSEMGLPCAFAIKGLLALWRAHAVAPDSTWKALQHKLGKDRRIQVQISLCKLLAEVPLLHNKTPEYDKLTESCAAKLWEMISDGNDPESVEAACDALANYHLEHYTLKSVPAIYRQSVKLPPSYCKTPADAARKPEDVLDYIPCEIWPEVYKNTTTQALPGVNRLVFKLIERCIRGLRSGVYSAKGEPPKLDYLPPHTVLRGIAHYVKKQATHPTYDCPDEVLLEMVRTLGAEYSKPLPPLDFCFLHELFHRGSHWKQPTLLLAARQAFTSGSAKRMLDNYLVNLEPDNVEESEIISLFQILPQLCRNMPPNSLREPIEKCLTYAYKKVSNLTKKEFLNSTRRVSEVTPNIIDAKNQGITKVIDDIDQEDSKKEFEEPLFCELLELIRITLENPRIHEANRKLLCGLLENYFMTIDESNVSFEPYISACLLMPQEQIERLSLSDAWWDISPSLARKCATLAAQCANTDLVLRTVYGSFECKTEYKYFLQCLIKGLTGKKATDIRDPLIELMAKLQTSFTEDRDSDTKLYFFDLFALTVIMAGGHWCLDDEPCERLSSDRALRLETLPSAVARLVECDGYTKCGEQISSWLSHSSVKGLDEQITTACRHALIAMRNSVNLIC